MELRERWVWLLTHAIGDRIVKTDSLHPREWKTVEYFLVHEVLREESEGLYKITSKGRGIVARLREAHEVLRAGVFLNERRELLPIQKLFNNTKLWRWSRGTSDKYGPFVTNNGIILSGSELEVGKELTQKWMNKHGLRKIYELSDSGMDNLNNILNYVFEHDANWVKVTPLAFQRCEFGGVGLIWFFDLHGNQYPLQDAYYDFLFTHWGKFEKAPDVFVVPYHRWHIMIFRQWDRKHFMGKAAAVAATGTTGTKWPPLNQEIIDFAKRKNIYRTRRLA